MADINPYEQDAAGANALAQAQQKTQQTADTQKAQEQKAEAPKGGGSKPAAKPAAGGTPGATPFDKAKGAAAGSSNPVVSGIGKVLGSFKKGGTVPKTGDYKLHEGEEVVPNNGRASEYRKIFKSRGDAGKHSWGGK